MGVAGEERRLVNTKKCIIPLTSYSASRAKARSPCEYNCGYYVEPGN